ncbi:MAG TPA: HAMP domain-containing sensor histidine kinase [Chitinophagaceae bacterium]|nr:HAMP domain-containing sensor histidine kinase [Chitinophagaceae bacterium]
MQFSIRSSTARLSVLISALIISIIIVIQLIWLKKVYRFEQKEFDISVLKTIRGLYEDLDIYSSTNLTELVERPEEHLYLARMKLPVNYDTLTSNLQFELEDFDIYTNCSIGLYDAAAGAFKYNTTLLSAGTHDRSNPKVPLLKKKYDYLALYFPNRRQWVLYEMNFWIISSVILLIVLIICGGSLYFFYRQKSLNEIQKEFVQNFTHEFKTPVATLALAAETLESKNIIEKPEKLATYAGIVKYQSDHLSKQIEKLLRFAHIESGRLHLARTSVDMHELIRESITHLTPLIQQKNARLQLNLNAGKSCMSGDRDYMLIMVTNLIENAIKYSKQPVITVTTINKPGQFILSIMDNGIGIEKKNINKLFRKFYRIHNNEEYLAKGFGIGLTFVKKIVTAHAGKIYVESIPGKGSTFTVELPGLK